jgi:cell division protein FtsL
VSTAARKLDATLPAAGTRVHPSRTPAARPPRTTPPHPRRRARRGSPLAFWILVAVVAASLIIGIASLSALFVQSSFSVDDLRTTIGALEQQHETLREQVAAASSPRRVMMWARQRGMQTPSAVVILPMPPTGDGA